MLRALREYEIEGLKTLLPFHEAILQTEQWARAETCRDLIEDRKWLKTLAFPKVEAAASAGASEAEGATVEQAYTVEVSGKRFDVKVIGPAIGGGAGGGGGSFAGGGAGAGAGAGARGNGSAAAGGARRAPRRERSGGRGGAGSGSGSGGGDTLASPIQGTVLRVAVEAGAAVEEGALVCVIEAMKMENEITAHKAGKVAELPIAVGASVATGDTLAVINSDGGG
jgi:acetyl-CoA/propionyl-CoA/long-chain acyl-CoA carboxylase, biotin carboxylase, biotin carboxyl carrier protein